ncbi:uncharacterized protein LOC120328201 [Styela clava]
MDELYLKLMWSNLFGLRLFFAIIPQYGLVNIEEFDSPKSMAGILGLPGSNEGDKEIFYSSITSGIPFIILRVVNSVGIFGNVITSYLVLVSPRIWMACCSIIIDILVYKIAVDCGSNKKTALTSMTLFASSYVTWIYCTRTVHVVFEMIIFAELILIGKSSNNIKKKQLDTISNILLMATLIVLGTSINSSLAYFAFIPVSFWVVFPFSSIKKCLLKSLMFSVAFLIVSVLFVVMWNTYSNIDIIAELFQNFDTTGLVALGLRFCFYEPSFSNIKPESNSHISDNTLQITSLLFTMYGPVVIYIFKEVRKQILCRQTFSTLMKRKDAILSYTLLLVIFLSIFFTSRVGFQMCIVIVPITVLVSQYVASDKVFFIIHCLFNLSGFMYYAIFKYGGAVHSMEFLGYLAKTATHIDNMEVVLYKTPLLPHYLMALPLKCETEMDVLCEEKNYANINFTEVTADNLQKSLDDLINQSDAMVILVIPGSISCQLIKKLRMLYDLQLYYKYFPHVINIHEIPDYANTHEWCDFNGGQHGKFSDLVEDKFTLNIFGVSKPMPRRPEIIERAKKLTIFVNNYSSSI